MSSSSSAALTDDGIAQALTAKLEDTYQAAGRETGYWGRRFLQALRRNGGLATAKRMLKPRTASQRSGLDVILGAGHPELTMEAIVLRAPFRQLFTEAELSVAGERLADHLTSRAPAIKVGSGSKSPSKNSPWSREELILALDLYMTHRSALPGKTSQSIVALSALLAKVGSCNGQLRVANYRNVNGVYMKLMNFRRFDPEYASQGKIGLKNGGQDEKIVWNQYANNLAELTATADAIRAALEGHVSGVTTLTPEEPDIEEAPEGKLLTRLHRTRERSRKLIDAAKRRALKAHGRLVCTACKFDFGFQYGDSHLHVIDCHHVKPVHAMKPGETTHIDDLVLLCANCHRAVHATRPWLSLADLQERIKQSHALASSSAVPAN